MSCVRGGGLVVRVILLRQVDAPVPRGVFANLLDSSGAVGGFEFPREPFVLAHFVDVLEEELDASWDFWIVNDVIDSLEILIHANLGFLGVEKASACFHDLSETLDVLDLLVGRLFAPSHQKLLAAAVEDGVVEYLELTELADELDVPQHLSLGQVFRLLFFGAEFSVSFFVSTGDSRSVLELMSTVAEQDSLEGGVLGVGGVKVRCIF